VLTRQQPLPQQASAQSLFQQSPSWRESRASVGQGALVVAKPLELFAKIVVPEQVALSPQYQ
jgi:hypothetical protein